MPVQSNPMPAGSAVRVHWSGALASHDLDAAGLVKIDDHTWTTSAFDAGQTHLELDVSANAGSLPLLLGAQFLAGGAWGCVLMSAVAAALAIGHTGREGTITGGLCALLAVATFARMGVVAAELNKAPTISALLPWAPVALWIVAGAILLAVVARHRAASVPSSA